MSTDMILVKRLVKLYDPVLAAFPPVAHEALNSALLDSSYLSKFEPQPEHAEYEERAYAYHVGRVRYFADLLRRREATKAIEIDAQCSGHYIGGPIVIDGHHRLMAHWILRKRRIEVSFSGRVDVLTYLKGDRRSPPPDL